MVKMRKLKNSIISFALALSMFGSVIASGGPLVVRAEDSAISLGPELVVNGDFGTGSGTITGINSSSEATVIGTGAWTALTSSELPLDYSITEDGMLKITETNTSGFCRVFEKLSLNAGTYKLSAKVKPVDVTDESAYAQLNASKFSAGTKEFKISAGKLVVGEWNDISYEFTLNEDTTAAKEIRIQIQGFYDNEYWLLDDFSLVKTDEPSTELLANGTFEGLIGLNAAIGIGKSFTLQAEDTERGIKCQDAKEANKVLHNFAVITEEGTTNAVLKISKATAAGKGQVSSTLSVPVAAGKTYVLSADVTQADIVDLSETDKASVTFTVGGQSVTKYTADLTESKVSANITIPAEVTEGTDLSSITIDVSNFTDGIWTIDNVSLKEVVTEPTLSVSVSATVVEQGGMVVLEADLDDPINQTTGSVTWFSNTEGVTITPNDGNSSKAVATVASNVAADTEVTITAYATRNDGGTSLSATCVFTVAQAATTLNVISITEERVSLEVGEQAKPEVILAPEDAVNKALIWSSNDEAVATVAEDGTITAIGVGYAEITATSQINSELSDSILVTVTKQIIENGCFDIVTGNRVEIPYSNGKEIIISESESGFLWRPIRGSGDSATDTTIYYEIVRGGRSGNAMKLWREAENNNSVRASIQQRKRTGFVEGEKYLITVYVMNKNVNADSYARISWSGKNLDGSGTHTSTTVAASDCNEMWTAITYEFVCGELNASSPQGAIEVQVRDWQKGEWYIDDVSIIQLPADPYFVMDEELSIEISNQTTVIACELIDRDEVLGENPIKIWASDDENVVKVDEYGKLIPVGIGTAGVTVTVSSSDGKYRAEAQCLVTITSEIIELSGLVFEDTSLTLQAGGQKSLKVNYIPEDASYKELIWSSSNEEIAQVSSDGIVTGIGEGSAIITATSKVNSELKAECAVTVSISTGLSAEKAEFVTAYGTTINGDLKNQISNLSDTEAVYTLYEAPAQGILTVNTDGTFVYVPGIYPEELGSGGIGARYTFKVLVTAGTESTVLEGTIIEKDLADTLAMLEITEDNHLFFSKEDIDAVKEGVKVEGSFKQKAWEQYKAYLDILVNTTPPKYEDYTDSENKEGVYQRDVGDQTMLLLGGYLISGDESYKEKCIEYALTSACYNYWSAGDNYLEGGLTAAHQAFALAMVYDWLKDDLSQDETQILLNRLYYAGQRLYSERVIRNNYLSNHLWIDNSALLGVALSLYYNAEDAASIIKTDIDLSNNIKEFEGSITKEELKNDCLTWIQWVCSDLGQAFYWLPDDGVEYESASYYNYGVSWLIKGSLLLEKELGIDVFTSNKFFENSIEFYSYVLMPEDHLNSNFTNIDYADGYRRSNSENVPIMGVLASKYQNSTARWIAETALEKKIDGGTSHYWMTLFFSDDEASVERDTSSTLFYSDDFGLVVSRSDWSGKESILFAKSGLPLGKDADWVLANTKSEYHSDPDANALILFANGEYLLKSDGRGYKDSKNHSTLFVKGAGAYAIQIGSSAISSDTDDKKNNQSDDFVLLDQEPVMTVIESTESYDYFVGEAAEAYYPEAGVRKFGRNFVFLKEENVLLVVDNIRTTQSTELQLRWFPESKTVAENYGIYSAYGENTTLNFYPFTTEGVDTSFSAVDVTLESMKTEEAFVQNYVGSLWQNAVAFSWASNGEAQPQVKYQTGNVNEHLFEVNGKIYTINVSENTLIVDEGTLGQSNAWASDSTLSSVLFNGAALEGFDGQVTEYNLERFWKTMEVEIIPVASAPTAEMTMDWNGECPGVVTITCISEDKSNSTTYTMNLKNEEGLLGIASTIAEPNVAGKDVALTYDNYVATNGSTKTWSSINLPVLTYDMGRMVDISKIDVAFNYSSKRNNFYNMYISQDGENWQLIHGENWDDELGYEVSLVTEGPAYNDYQTIYSGDTLRTRYVRLALRGNSESYVDDLSKYGSIQEISIYGEEVVSEVMNPEIVVDSTDTSYTLGSNEEVTITSTGDFSKFESIAMDGVIVDESNYTVEEGSTIVTFKTEYLEMLSEGEHAVTINYTGGSSVTSNLTISKADDSDTESDSNGESDTGSNAGGDTDNTNDSDAGNDNDTCSDSDTIANADNDEDDSNDTDNSAETSGTDVTTASSTNTGDSGHMGLWIGLIAVCLLGAATVINKKRIKHVKVR